MMEKLGYPPEFRTWFRARGDLALDLTQAKTYFDKLMALKKYYLKHEKEFISSPRVWISSYPCSWEEHLTKIEFMAWQTIRTKGQIVLYPQYPVLNYHIDFASPGLKIGLELDGAKFHNKERDRLRDAALNRSGWAIYRVTGKDMYRSDFKEPFDLTHIGEYKEVKKHLQYWLLETGDGVIEAIKSVHFLQSNYDPFGEELELNQEYYNLCKQTLENHQLSYGTH